MAQSEGPHRGFAPPEDAMSAVRVAFPQDTEDFEQDPRVSFSKLDNKWILEDDDGSEWEYNEAFKKWIPLLDESLLEQQRAAYAIPGVSDEAEPPNLKRKKEQGEPQNGGGKKARNSNKSKTEKPKPERKNCAVYVTSIPHDATIDEIHSVFSKFGVIAEEIDSGAPRIKIYQDENGKPKGDVLVVYFRPESVSLAITMLDDTDFRMGQEGPAGKMSVKEADYSYKKQQEAPTQQSTKDKKKIVKRAKRLNDKLADWSGDEDISESRATSGRWDKVVVLKHMFTVKELEENPSLYSEIADDIQLECSKLGDVVNVTLYDKESEGIATVRFANAQAANALVVGWKDRRFGGQPVEPRIATGDEKFKKTKEKKAAWEDNDAETKRLDDFGEWLENEGKEAGGGEEVR